MHACVCMCIVHVFAIPAGKSDTWKLCVSSRVIIYLRPLLQMWSRNSDSNPHIHLALHNFHLVFSCFVATNEFRLSVVSRAHIQRASSHHNVAEMCEIFTCSDGFLKIVGCRMHTLLHHHTQRQIILIFFLFEIVRINQYGVKVVEFYVCSIVIPSFLIILLIPEHRSNSVFN